MGARAECSGNSEGKARLCGYCGWDLRKQKASIQNCVKNKRKVARDCPEMSVNPDSVRAELEQDHRWDISRRTMYPNAAKCSCLVGLHHEWKRSQARAHS
jgi:hypothetical protein